MKETSYVVIRYLPGDNHKVDVFEITAKSFDDAQTKAFDYVNLDYEGILLTQGQFQELRRKISNL